MSNEVSKKITTPSGCLSSIRIILLGFMGSGKTTVGQQLHEQLDIPLLEMDTEIIKKSKRTSIPEIFSHEGESHFRELERQVAEESKDTVPLIISCGGGVVDYPLTMKALLASPRSLGIFLETTFTTIEQRLSNTDGRPLFKERSQALQLFNNRLERYHQFADICINTDTLSPEQITQQLLQKVEQQHEFEHK